MKRIFDIVGKDISQTLRSPMAALFLIAMPLMFTAFFGLIFQGVAKDEGAQEKPLVAVVGEAQDGSILNELQTLFQESGELTAAVFTTDEYPDSLILFEEKEAVAVLSLPEHFQFLSQDQTPATLYVDETSSEGQTALYTIQRVFSQQQILYSTSRLAVQVVDEQLPYASDQEYQAALEQVLAKAGQAWDKKAVTVSMERAVTETTDLSRIESAYDQSSPGMLVQFTISGLMGTAIIFLQERRTKTLQRMLTTATSRSAIIIAHALSMFFIIVAQQIILVLSGHFLFGVDYLREPLAILLVIVAFALWVSGMGTLIGVSAKNEDQVVLFSLIAMFLFTAMGGAWFTLENTSPGFYAIARYTPGAQAMQGLQNIIVRKQGLSSVFAPVGMLLLYAFLFYAAAILIFKKNKE